MDLLNTSLVQLRIANMKGQLSESLLNSWCIYTTHYSQFCEGVTGVNIQFHVYVKTATMGFAYAAEAYKKAKECGIKNYRRQGKAETDIGAVEDTRVAMTIGDLLADSNIISEPTEVLSTLPADLRVLN